MRPRRCASNVWSAEWSAFPTLNHEAYVRIPWIYLMIERHFIAQSEEAIMSTSFYLHSERNLLWKERMCCFWKQIAYLYSRSLFQNKFCMQHRNQEITKHDSLANHLQLVKLYRRQEWIINSAAPCEKRVFGHMRTAKTWSTCASAQSDQGIPVYANIFIDTTEYMTGAQRTGYFAHTKEIWICAFTSCSKALFRLTRPNWCSCLVFMWHIEFCINNEFDIQYYNQTDKTEIVIKLNAIVSLATETKILYQNRYCCQNAFSSCLLGAVEYHAFKHQTNRNVRKTYHRTCGPSEDSDQTAHSRSLIRIFTGRILDSQGCKISSCGQRRF